MGVTTTPMTFEEFERLPDEPGKFELLDGELIQLPPAKRTHLSNTHWLLRILTDILKELHERGEARELGAVYHEGGYRIGPRAWLQPDVSITWADQPGGDYFEQAPALAVEVISPANTAEQMDRKVKNYLANGGREVWLVYPKTQRVWIYEAGGRASEAKDTIETKLLPGVAIALDEMWAIV